MHSYIFSHMKRIIWALHSDDLEKAQLAFKLQLDG